MSSTNGDEPDPPTAWHCETAWLGGAVVFDDVNIYVRDGVIESVETGAPAAPGAERLRGIVLPGLANVHSHAFHRALRGVSHDRSATGTFWSWRDTMYDIAAALDPEKYEALARATYAEMALAGITAVGEFHYLHHDRGGHAYDDANEMGDRLVAAARAAGVRLTLLDTCYLRSGFDEVDLNPVQRRFSDGSVGNWSARASASAEKYGGEPDIVIGAAVHSVRAVTADDIAGVATWAVGHGVPLHAHVSEQRAENDACMAALGATPTQVLDGAGALRPSFVAVHATHVDDDDDVIRLGLSGSGVCVCPTTERDLGDGVGRASLLGGAGCPLSVGSDSHAVIDLFEEVRAIELDERLVSGRRGIHDPTTLLHAATTHGYRSLGFEGGQLLPGAAADFIAVSTTSTRLAGWHPERAAAHVVFSATAADVTDVVVGGEAIVRDRIHQLIPDVAGQLDRAIRAVLP